MKKICCNIFKFLSRLMNFFEQFSFIGSFLGSFLTFISVCTTFWSTKKQLTNTKEQADTQARYEVHPALDITVELLDVPPENNDIPLLRIEENHLVKIISKFPQYPEDYDYVPFPKITIKNIGCGAILNCKLYIKKPYDPEVGPHSTLSIMQGDSCSFFFVDSIDFNYALKYDLDTNYTLRASFDVLGNRYEQDFHFEIDYHNIKNIKVTTVSFPIFKNPPALGAKKRIAN